MHVPKIFLEMTSSLKYIYILQQNNPYIFSLYMNRFSCLKPFLLFYNLILQQTFLHRFCVALILNATLLLLPQVFELFSCASHRRARFRSSNESDSLVIPCIIRMVILSDTEGPVDLAYLSEQKLKNVNILFNEISQYQSISAPFFFNVLSLYTRS